MICFFTSSPFIPDSPDLNPANGFLDELHAALPHPCRVLYICSDPDNFEAADLYGGATAEALENADFALVRFDILDRRNAEVADRLIRAADFIILAGGHVPTQNRFFAEIGLRELLEGFDGVLMGISAGSMNSADVVYAHPELEGEAVDPEYERFLPGLGLTDIMIIPHYQQIQDDLLDGLHLFDDIAIPDSEDNAFCVLPDGSYVLSRDGAEELRGEAYWIENGVMEQISEEGDIIPLC